DGRQRIGTDAHRHRSRRYAPPAREHGEATRGPGRAPVLPRVQAWRSPISTRRRHEVPGAEPLTPNQTATGSTGHGPTVHEPARDREPVRHFRVSDSHRATSTCAGITVEPSS